MTQKNTLRFIFAVFFVTVLVTAANAQPLPSCYHTRAEIDSFIFALQAEDPVHVHVDSIGHSRGDMLGVQYPIWAVKISGNATVFEDKPTALIIGHIHAEEVIGLEMTLQFMWQLVHPFGLYRELLNNTQLYFIPTINPDGLEVISRGLDNTWRKNGYQPPELDGYPCTIHVGAGGDSCGVDLNRNFGLNWLFGDTLWYPIRTPLFDYYSGPAAFSEPEARAVAAFAERIRPTVSVVYHSSRQGGNAKLGIAAWKWGEDPGPYRFPPDCTAIGWLDFNYCQRLGDEQYSAVYGNNHDGNLQDWFYWKLGCVQINNEIGPLLNIQPTCSTLTRIINEDMPALEWLCKRPANIGLDGLTPLSIYTRDTSGHAISARFKILNTWSPVLASWYTNSDFGRATVFPPTGSVRIAAFKFGYRPDTVSTSVNPISYPQQVQLDLVPLPWHWLQIPTQDSAGQPLLTHVHFDNADSSLDYFVNGSLYVNLPEGEYSGRFWADGHMTVWRNFYLGGDMMMPVTLPPAYALFSDSFETGLGNWNSGGTNNPWRLAFDTTAVRMGQSLVFNPPGFRQVYAPNMNTWIRMNSTVNLTGNLANLEFYRRGRMDAPNDSLLVEISTDGGSAWQPVADYCDQDFPWTRTFVDLSRFCGNSILVRFRVISDAILGELGYHLDDIKVFGGTDLAAPEHPLPAVYTYRITNAYPNPFNPTTTIAYETAAPGAVLITVHNVLGQEVRRFDVRAVTAGAHQLFWDGTSQNGAPLGSGVYFVRLHEATTQNTVKLLLLR